MQTQAIKLLENNPALWKRMNESKDVTLSQHFPRYAGSVPLTFPPYILIEKVAVFSK